MPELEPSSQAHTECSNYTMKATTFTLRKDAQESWHFMITQEGFRVPWRGAEEVHLDSEPL